MNPPPAPCPRSSRRRFLAGLLLTTGATGCLNLKPREQPVRHFVLTLPPPPNDSAGGPPPPAGARPHAIGLGPVQIAGYLTRASLAVRSGPTEMRYAELNQWAEPLATGIPRVLAEGLRRRLPGAQVRTTAWRRSDVTVELYVTVTRFDVEPSGTATLDAHWRLAAPGDTRPGRPGGASWSRPGPSPQTDPAGTVATLGALLADLADRLGTEVEAASAAS